MKLISTRNKKNRIDALDGVLKGIADDGGLFVPEALPRISSTQLMEYKGKRYEDIAVWILSMFFDIPEATLQNIVQSAYSGFDDENIVPITKLTKNDYVLELYHGPTLAFKDMALQILPYLMSEAIGRSSAGKDVLILTATSGDTGKAALAGFADVPRTKISVFYPNEGVSYMQKLQMITQEGDNTYVAAINGNFDDAQTAVKSIFADEELCRSIAANGYVLSSANSINIGRLIPQIVYYVYAYTSLLSEGEITLDEKINICVPTGNFGNILAAYYALQMGIPIDRLICASNRNNVLSDFFDSGRYVANRPFYKTISPSMDILISSNLERLLFEASGRDSDKVCDLMHGLAEMGEYNASAEMMWDMNQIFYANYADDNKARQTIRRIFEEKHYLIDTHTAVAMAVLNSYRQQTGVSTKTVVASTAHPFKFVRDVLLSLQDKASDDPFETAELLSAYTGVPIPQQISGLKEAPVRFEGVLEKTELKDWVRKITEVK